MNIVIDILMFFCIAGVIGIGILVIYIIYTEMYNSNLRYESCEAAVKVTGKRHENEYISNISLPIKFGNITTFNKIPQYHNEKFIVYVQYDGNEYSLNNEKIFNSTSVGSYIKVRVNKGYNKKGELKNVYLI